MSPKKKKGRPPTPADTGGPWDTSGPWVAEGEDADDTEAADASGPGDPIPIANPVLGRSSGFPAVRPTPAPVPRTSGGYTFVLKRAREALLHHKTGDLPVVPSAPPQPVPKPADEPKQTNEVEPAAEPEQWGKADTSVTAEPSPVVDSSGLQAQIDALAAQLHETQRQLAEVLATRESHVDEAPWAPITTAVAEQLFASDNNRTNTNRIDRFLRLMVRRGASDLHLSVGHIPSVRVDGELDPIRRRRLMEGDWRRLVEPIVPAAIWKRFLTESDADLAYEVKDLGRFRVNLFRGNSGLGAVFRLGPWTIPDLDELGLPHQVEQVLSFASGLVFVTGPTGSGKSTTLAALIDRVNRQRKAHCITIEDPIEFVHTNRECFIQQREVGTHSPDFATAVASAAREDPDLLLVGEMRDLETIRHTLDAAQKGLLVLTTVHTNGAAKTIDRIISVFPSNEQPSVRAALSNCLRAVVSQQLLPRKGGGRIAAAEVLLSNRALRTLIRDGKTHQIASFMQTHRGQGMLALNDCLSQLVKKDLITQETAYERASDRTVFQKPKTRRLEAQLFANVLKAYEEPT